MMVVVHSAQGTTSSNHPPVSHARLVTASDALLEMYVPNAQKDIILQIKYHALLVVVHVHHAYQVHIVKPVRMVL